MLDLLFLSMGLTLLVAGWFLVREFAHFLHCAYCLPGVVAALVPGRRWHHEDAGKSVVRHAMLPVIHYEWLGQSTAFTCIDAQIAQGLQIGDRIKLAFSRTRRADMRSGRSVLGLVGSMVFMATALLVSRLVFDQTLTMLQILSVTLILTLCSVILVLYLRQQEECTPGGRYPMSDMQNGRELFLPEPTNVHYWKRLFIHRSQRRRILASRLAGACCLLAGAAVLLISLPEAFQSQGDLGGVARVAGLFDHAV